MSKMPRLRGREVIAALTEAGFVQLRSKGSHYRLRHPDGRCTSVPVHAGEQIGPGLLSKILRDVEMTREQFESYL
jgi:predicted RNA binding protein YcfA (HicA-like mRNA interferase family)